MAFGGAGVIAKYGGGFGGGQKPKPVSVMDKYNPETTVTATQGAVPQGITDQMNNISQLPTGYTPAQQLAMRNRIAATDTAQAGGGMNRIAEMMAARGLGGSGAETGAMGNYLRDISGARQSALSNLDLSNAQLDLSNRYNQAGLMNQLTGMGEQGRQFGVGQYNNMFQYGTSFDEQRRLADQGRNDYYQQLEEWKKSLGNGGYGGSGSSGGGSYSVNRGRGR